MMSRGVTVRRTTEGCRTGDKARLRQGAGAPPVLPVPLKPRPGGDVVVLKTQSLLERRSRERRHDMRLNAQSKGGLPRRPVSSPSAGPPLLLPEQPDAGGDQQQGKR